MIVAVIFCRSLPDRRDAMARDLPLKLYKQNRGKQLTAPHPEVRTPPPNLAMLNPDAGLGGMYEPAYLSNYPKAASATRIASTERDELVESANSRLARI